MWWRGGRGRRRTARGRGRRRAAGGGASPTRRPSALPSRQARSAQHCAPPINQSITFKVHGEPAGVSWDWAGGEGCVSGVHSIGRGTVRCGRRLAGPARPVGWKLRAGISVRSGCGGWCRGGIERGSVPRLLWEQGNGGSAGHVPVGQWLPRGRWGRSDRGRRMRGKTSHRVGALGGEGLSSGSAMPCRKSRRGRGGCQWAICGRRRSGRVCGGGVGFRQSSVQACSSGPSRQEQPAKAACRVARSSRVASPMAEEAVQKQRWGRRTEGGEGRERAVRGRRRC